MGWVWAQRFCIADVLRGDAGAAVVILRVVRVQEATQPGPYQEHFLMWSRNKLSGVTTFPGTLVCVFK